jgi:hypothetical protein
MVLRVPNYVIFEPESGLLEVYRLNDSGQYKLASANSQQKFLIDELGLSLGIWQGTRENRTDYWLRWWNDQNELLPWGKEQAEQERQRAEQKHQRAERLTAQLRAAGLNQRVNTPTLSSFQGERRGYYS